MCTLVPTSDRNVWKETVEEEKEWIYGHDWVALVTTRRTWSCRTRYWLPSNMLPEGIRGKVKEQERIQSEFLPCHLFISPMIGEFSLYTDPLSFGGFFFNFPICLHVQRTVIRVSTFG